jgi:hypothetical protein
MRLFLNDSSFDKAAREHVYSTQSKPAKGFENMSLAFVDSNGVRYYKYNDDFDLPLERKGKLDRYYGWLSSMMDGSEVSEFCEKMSKLVDQSINTLTLDGRIEGLAQIQLIINEMIARKNLIVHEDIYFRIMGVQYISEHQNPAVWDDEIENAKIKQFKEDSKGGLYDFFYTGPLQKHMAFYGVSEQEWTDYLNESRAIIQGQKNYLDMLSSEAKS